MKALTYVEVDIEYCALTYGVAPCAARLGFVDSSKGATFDGTTDYLTRGAGLTGAADSKLLTFSGWFKWDGAVEGGRVVASVTTVGGATQRTRVHFDSTPGSNRFSVSGYNAAGAQILAAGAAQIPVAGRWCHYLFSADLSNAAKRHLYIDDVSDVNVGTHTNDTIDFTMADWGVGALPDGSIKLDGDLADVWFMPGVYIDFSVEANRRKFIDSMLRPVGLGADGSLPTGTPPLIFLSGEIAAWHTNKGTGGGFTVHGALAEASFVTGVNKCFNTRKTCQDIAHFDSDADTSVAGQGLKAEYWNNRYLEGVPALTQVDTPWHDFGLVSPHAAINADEFSIRWTGFVLSPVTGNVTFYILVDDGGRLWLDDELVIDQWVNQAVTTYSVVFAATVGQLIKVKFEYYENLSAAVAKLEWSYTAQAQIKVPTAKLYAEGLTTLRFAVPTDYLPREIESIPSIKEVHSVPAIVSLSGDLGQRAAFTVTLRDHPWSDAGEGFDKYVAERAYDPFTQGTFWGKFRARQPYLRGRPLRVIRGLLGQELDEMETRHYLIDSFDGPMPDGTYQLVAKDILKLADGDRAQAPVLSNGFLISAITNVATSATLSPTGIGALEYPASGYVAIGGKEICAFTRSGDVLTLTRAQLGTVAQAHSAQDRVQLVLRYVGVDPATIIADLLENYAAVDPAFIPVADWLVETAANLQRVYTATLAEPTAVKALINELVEQAGLAMWWDDIGREIRLQVLRAVPTDADTFTEDNVLKGSLKIREQPGKRESQVWVYFGQINPLEAADEAKNYRSVSTVTEPTAEDDYGSPVIKKIYSRWIAAFGRSSADKVGALRLARFRDPPRRFNFDLFSQGPVDAVLGGGYQLTAWPLQDALGAASSAAIQLTQVNAEPDKTSVEAEEVLFTNQPGSSDDGIRYIIIDTDAFNINLRTTHDTLYPAITGSESPAVSIVCIIAAGAIVGSAVTALASFIVGSWPVGTSVTLRGTGKIEGAGGAGGVGGGSGFGVNGSVGNPGGTALYTRFPVKIELPASGKIWSGGGGGGGGGQWVQLSGGFAQDPGGGGGGGAGVVGGAGGGGAGPVGAEGSPTAGGVGAVSLHGGRGGNGGSPGVAGGAGNGSISFGSSILYAGGAGGAAGIAIDGVSFITYTVTGGQVLGGQVN